MFTDNQVLDLPVRPVTSVTTIHDTGGNEDGAYEAGDLVDSGDYVLDGVKGRVYLKDTATLGGWSVGRRVVKVVYVAGYDTGAHPAITEALSQLVAYWWAVVRHSKGAKAGAVAGRSTTGPASTSIPLRVQELMGTYKLWERAA